MNSIWDTTHVRFLRVAPMLVLALMATTARAALVFSQGGTTAYVKQDIQLGSYHHNSGTIKAKGHFQSIWSQYGEWDSIAGVTRSIGTYVMWYEMTPTTPVLISHLSVDSNYDYDTTATITPVPTTTIRTTFMVAEFIDLNCDGKYQLEEPLLPLPCQAETSATLQGTGHLLVDESAIYTGPIQLVYPGHLYVALMKFSVDASFPAPSLPGVKFLPDADRHTHRGLTFEFFYRTPDSIVPGIGG